MSLINDALRKARLEAARKDATRSTTPLPNLHHAARERTGSLVSPATVVLLALGAIAVGIVATLLIDRSPANDAQIAASSPERTEALAPDRQAVAEASAEGATAPPQDAPPVAAAESIVEKPAPVASPPALDLDRTPTRSRVSTPPTSRQDAQTDLRQESTSASAPADQPSTAETTGSSASARSESPSESPEVTAEATPAAMATNEPARPEPSVPSAESSASSSEPAARQSLERETAAAETGESTTAVDDRSAASSDDEVESFLREASIPGVGTFRLDGIAWSSDQPFALVNGEVVSAGGFVDGVAVTEVGRDRVVLARDGLLFELRLR